MKEMRTNGRSFMNVVGYTNLDELMKLIAPHSFRVTKSECLDLPEKLYMKRYVQLSVEQRKLYNQLKKEVVAELNGTTMSAPLALTRLLRLQQIVGGFFVPDADINGVIENTDSEDCITIVPKNNISTAPQSIDSVNPRIESLIELLQETQGKVIIWARFRSEIAAICERIKEEFGQCYVEYHGGVNNDQRGFAVESFQKVPEIRFFIGHVQAGGKGLTLHSAQTVVYYSNDFSLENRLQSEDRAHRIGQVNHVTYVDMIAVNTMDEKIVKVLQNKKSLADLITGDEPIENWL
jgi:SNF2 family DNA or RNA helicase